MSVVDPKFNEKFGEYLSAAGVIDPPTLASALKVSKTTNRSLVEVLAQDHHVEEALLYRFLSQKTGLAYKNLKEEKVDPKVIQRVPVKVVGHYGFMPIDLNNGHLTIAVDSPLSVKVQDEIHLQIGCSLTQVLARKQDIIESFKKYYGFGAETVERIVSSADFENPAEEEAISSIGGQSNAPAGDRSAIDLVNEIIFEAFQKRATDIHFEPFRGEFRVRYRIDGILHDVNLSRDAQRILSLILSRIKIMANLDITEKRTPQDGRAIVKIKNQTLDLRISCIPASNSESIVIRILPVNMIHDIKKLGLSDKNVEIFEKLIRRPNGIILLTGPTGSGKTTTLYACLNRINSKERKIITIEDPVEYEISGITQIQIASKVGLDFAKGLRSMLRHDPDVMMVGEIRDFETAQISIRAALTGHLVFSTLHTNDSASGVTRLMDIGVEPFLVTSGVASIIAQRLVRRICHHCKVEDTAKTAEWSPKIQRDLGMKPGSVRVYKGKGCETCGHSGFYGRTAIHEVLVLTEEIKRLILRKASSHEIKMQAVAEGMLTLVQDGWLKVMDGQTTPEEIMNVALSDEDGTGEMLEPVSATPPVKDDRRLYQRAPLSIPVRYRILDSRVPSDDKAVYSGAASDVSASGLFLIEVDRTLSLGDILHLTFKIREREIQCLAKVMRLEEKAGGGAYQAGVMFLDLTTADRAFLDDFISQNKG